MAHFDRLLRPLLSLLFVTQSAHCLLCPLPSVRCLLCPYSVDRSPVMVADTDFHVVSDEKGARAAEAAIHVVAGALEELTETRSVEVTQRSPSSSLAVSL